MGDAQIIVAQFCYTWVVEMRQRRHPLESCPSEREWICNREREIQMGKENGQIARLEGNKLECVSGERTPLVLNSSRLKMLEQVEEILPGHQVSPVGFRIR